VAASPVSCDSDAMSVLSWSGPRRLLRGSVLVGGSACALALATAGTLPAASASTASPPVVAPYLDMPGANTGNLSAAIGVGLSSVTAAFVIGKGCTPTWDDGTPVAKDPRVAALITDAQSAGAQVVVSFGGAGGRELARTCTDVARLTAAYQSVIDRFGVTQIDFDIEGAAIKPKAQKASIARRFAALRAIETSNPELTVSATLGVGQSGLLGPQMSFLRVAQQTQTRIDLVNIMTMDYGSPVPDMGAVAIQAAEGSLSQLQSIWPAATYANLGITPMIGDNDSGGEVTSLQDAATIQSFAAAHGVGRLAFWSLNRDQQCSQGSARARGNCSGVQQKRLDFTRAFLGSADSAGTSR
jgi:hypothetical protein